MQNVAVASGSIARPGLAPSQCFSSVDLPPWLLPGAPSNLPCLMQPELFFPDNYGLQYRDQIEDARRACDFCPLRPDCKMWSVPKTDLDGIFAGITPPERRRIRTGKAK